MDQSFIAGLGNIYSDEILWEAGPAATTARRRRCRRMEIRRLYRALVEMLHEADQAPRLDACPTSSTSTCTASPASYQLLHKVYDREGQACRRCRTPIAARKFGQPLDLLLPQLPGLIP